MWRTTAANWGAAGLSVTIPPSIVVERTQGRRRGRHSQAAARLDPSRLRPVAVPTSSAAARTFCARMSDSSTGLLLLYVLLIVVAMGVLDRFEAWRLRVPHPRPAHVAKKRHRKRGGRSSAGQLRRPLPKVVDSTRRNSLIRWQTRAAGREHGFESRSDRTRVPAVTLLTPRSGVLAASWGSHGRANQRPCQLALRFSRKARAPSLKSSLR